MNFNISLSLLCAVFITFISNFAQAGDWSGLTWETQYKNPLAYPRSPEFSVSWENLKDKGIIKAALGKDLGLITYSGDDLHVTFGLEFAAWLTLGYRNESMAFPLITEDFIFSVPISFRYNNFSGALKYNHISAHLGDGADEMLDVSSFAYSREFVSVHLSHDSKNDDFKTRFYGHVGYLIVVMPECLGRWFAGGGFETVIFELNPSPYLAVDATWNNDVGSLDLSGQIGLRRSNKSLSDLDIRIAISGYYGSDRRGQLVGRKLNNIGIGIFIR